MMGGRGAASGGPTTEGYHDVLDQIERTSDPATLEAQGRGLREGYGNRSTDTFQEHAMTAPVDMESTPVEGVTVRYSPALGTANRSLGIVASTWHQIPERVRGYTTEILLTDQVVPGNETGIATGGAGDHRIVTYGPDGLDKITLVHEVVHNYMIEEITDEGGLGGTGYAAVVDGDEPSPYTGPGGAYEEDFAESTAMLILDPSGFTAAYPQRAQVIQDYLDGNFY